ncbi:methylenetetrahydrofolate reductase C-terminal domain-containing protein [Candidatus Latescibacterota bacterium]
MIVTEKKTLDEILESLRDDRKIFLLGCNGCADVCDTGGETAVAEMREALEKAGKTIIGQASIDFLCNKILVKMRLLRYANELKDMDSILILTCGIGVQAVATVVGKVTHPALNTISLGGFQGLWPSDERCGECGDCVLDLTGGICPITSCAKSLLNGQCGGAREGKCEVDREKDCGWEKIYLRLKEIGRLDNMKVLRKIRDYDNMIPSKALRDTYFYDYEKV